MLYYSIKQLKIGGVWYGANSRLPDRIHNVGALIARGEIKIVNEPPAQAAVAPEPVVMVEPTDADQSVETVVRVGRGGRRGSSFSKD